MVVIEIQPAHDLTFGDATVSRVQSVVFGADNHIYATISDTSLNAWSIVVYYWPEVLGAILALVLLTLFVPIIRIARRPQVAGAPHCRRCNYDLSASPADGPCPECGVELARVRPIRGRARRRRLLIPLGIGVILAVSYASPHVFGVPRKNRASYAFDWHAPRLAAYARDKSIAWLKRHIEPVSALVEIDPATGRTLRTVRRLEPMPAFRLSLGPDGQTCVTTLRGGRLGAIDLHTGRIIRTVRRLDGGSAPSTRWGGSCWLHVAGWLDEDSLCVQFLDQMAGTNTLYRWDIRASTLDALADIPVPDSVRSAGGVQTLVKRLLYLVPRSDPILAFEVQDGFGEALSYGHTSTIRVRDLGDEGRVVHELEYQFWSSVAPVFHPHGTSFYIRTWGSPKDMVLWSVDAWRVVDTLEAPGFMGTLQDGPAGLAYDEATNRLYVATTTPNAVSVRDMSAGQWIAKLWFGFDGLPDDYIALSPDGHWAALAVTATGRFSASPAASRFTSHLVVFDLTAVESGQ
jgi:hypothetical protein